MRSNQNIGLIIYPVSPARLLIPLQHLSFPLTPAHTCTPRFAFILSIHLSCPSEKLKVSKGLGNVPRRRNLYAKSVVSGDIAADLGSG